MSDNNTDTNLKTIYSPLGEKFEVAPANHIDLMRHARWTEHKPHPDAVREHCAKHRLPVPAEYSGAAAAPTETPAPAPAPTETPAPAPAPTETPAPAPAPTETSDNEAGANAPAVKTEASDFDGLDRDAVRDYIVATYPGTEIDGRKGRDALVAQALELAAARA